MARKAHYKEVAINKTPNPSPPPPQSLPDPLPEPLHLSGTQIPPRPVTSGRLRSRLLEIPGCDSHGCHRSGTAMEIESRAARKALGVGASRRPVKGRKMRLLGGKVPKRPSNCASALPVNLPSFALGVAPFGRVGPPCLLGHSFCAGF